jgi:probable rRNA maturation factor
MIINEQSQRRVDLAAARGFARRLRRILGLGDRHFNVCFVNDERIADLNRVFRRKPHATDVLSFPWDSHVSSSLIAKRPESRMPAHSGPSRAAAGDFSGFLGDVVISVETAERNARAEGHAVGREISWLILHGLLHLLGMNHAMDHGEMIAMEYDLRALFGLDGGSRPIARSQTRRKRRTRPYRSQDRRSRRG